MRFRDILIWAGTPEEGAMDIRDRNRQQEQAVLEGAPGPAPGMNVRTSMDDYEHLLKITPASDGGSGEDD